MTNDTIMPTKTLDKEGVYNLGIVDGNVIITNDNVTLKYTIVKDICKYKEVLQKKMFACKM